MLGNGRGRTMSSASAQWRSKVVEEGSVPVQTTAVPGSVEDGRRTVVILLASAGSTVQ